MKWISEAERLPKIAQNVLLAMPRQGGDFWDLKVAQLLVRHEDVEPDPVKKGMRWPVDFWWSWNYEGGASAFVTGNSWWTLLNDIELPPGAEHKMDRGFHYVVQPKPVWVLGD